MLNTLEVQLRPLSGSLNVDVGDAWACWENFGLAQYSLYIDWSKESNAENLVKIASELSVLEPI